MAYEAVQFFLAGYFHYDHQSNEQNIDFNATDIW